MRRRVFVIASWYPSATSPVAGIFVQEQARLLSEQYEVIVLSPQVVGIRDVLRGRGRRIVERDGDLLVYREYTLVPPYGSTIRLLGYLLSAWRGMRRLIRERGLPDLFHAHVVLPCGWAAAQASRKLGVPAVLTEHSGPFAMHLRTPVHRQLVRTTLHSLRTLAVSPVLRQQILSFAPDVDVGVLPNVIATRFFSPEVKVAATVGQRKTRFLTVALLTRGKGIQYLLEAVSLLFEHGEYAFELVIGGDGPDRRRLERIARDRGIADHCRFVGLLDQTQVRDWIRWCDVFVLPSLHETFGIVIGEAMACGKPVIATRCGGPEYVVEEGCGLLVPPADAPALADAMQSVLAGRVRFDPEFVRRSVTARFGEDAFLRSVAAIYDELWARKA